MRYGKRDETKEYAAMVNLKLLAGNETEELLSVRGASQLTGGMLSERRIWQLVKEQRLSFIKDGESEGIPISEIMRFVGSDVGKAA
jgi:hypothetical protein